VSVQDKPTMRPEALEAFRYRRKWLTNKRTHLMRRAAEQIEERGKATGTTNRRLKIIEAEIRAYNSIADEYGLQEIR
jgi:hypothetical protein